MTLWYWHVGHPLVTHGFMVLVHEFLMGRSWVTLKFMILHGPIHGVSDG